MEKLVEKIKDFLQQLFPTYDVIVRHEHRVWRATKPTIVISVGESRYTPITIGYGSVKEESTLTITVIHPMVPDGISLAFERACGDIARLMGEVMRKPCIGEYILVLLENTRFAEMLRNPGIAVASVSVMALRIIQRPE